MRIARQHVGDAVPPPTARPRPASRGCAGGAAAFDSSGMCSADAFADDLLDRHPRRQRRERILEHDLHPPAHRAQRRAVGVVEARAFERDAAGGDRLQREQRHAERRLARARLADDAERLAALQLERRVAHRVEHVLAEPAAWPTRSRRDTSRAAARTGASAGTGCTARCGRLLISLIVYGCCGCANTSARRRPARPAARAPSRRRGA